METSLLRTKLNIPPARSKIVPRPRLIERLKEGLSYNLILVSAPAGFGKTTLLSEWARISQSQIRVAWISLDEGDNDPVRFFEYIIAALQTLQPGYGEKILQWLHSSQMPSIEPILTMLINDFYFINGIFVIVLDDYHLIESKQIHNGVTYLIEHLPAQVHLVIATRADPPLPLARFRGKGMLLEIRTDDLRFTQDDAVSLLKELKMPGLTAKDIAALNEHTEGWVVGLKMAALSMKEQKDIPNFIATFTGSQRYIMDYLIEEVLKHQSEDVRHFLLKTSVLEKFTAPLCDCITDRDDSQHILVDLEASFTGFLVPLDESRQWYRYHHLFCELLRHQLKQLYSATEITLLHDRASEWYENHGYVEEAIRHALILRDWGQAKRLITSSAEERLSRGELLTLLAWCREVPEEFLRNDLQLYAQYARTLVYTGQLDTGENALSYLERTVQADDALQGEVATLQADLARRKEDQTLTIKLARKALSLLPADSLTYRARASYVLGVVLFSRGDFDQAWSLFTNTADMARRGGDYLMAADALAHLASILDHQGRLQSATESCQQAIKLAGQLPAAALARHILAKVQYERNELDEAIQNQELAVKLFDLTGIPELRPQGYLHLATYGLARGDVTGVAEALEKVDQILLHSTIRPGIQGFIPLWRGILALRQGDTVMAVDWANRFSPYASLMNFNGLHYAARLLIILGQRKEAASQLHDLYEQAVKIGVYGLAIQIRVYQALATEDSNEALFFLTDALIKGEVESYTRTFVDEGRFLRPLLRQLLSRGVTPEYVTKLLVIINAEERRRRTVKNEPLPIPESSEFLTRRELEVMQLVADGMSNQQIAEKLTISLTTARTHVYHVFAKLNAKDRLHAVTRARELKLI